MTQNIKVCAASCVPHLCSPSPLTSFFLCLQATLGALITLQVLTLPSWALTIALFSSSFLGYTIAAFFAPVLMAIVMLAMVMSSNAMQGDVRPVGRHPVDVVCVVTAWMHCVLVAQEWSRVISNKQWKWDAAPGPAVYLTLMPLVFVALIVLGSFVVLCFGKLCGSSNRGSSSHHSSSSPASRNRPWRSKHTPTTPPHERRAPTSSSAQPATNANNNVTSVSGRHAGDAGLYGSSQPSNPHGQPPNPYGQPANPYGAAPAPAYGQPSAPAHGFSGPWMCSTCTLSNPASAQQCTMCTSARPAPSAYPTAPDPNRSALI